MGLDRKLAQNGRFGWFIEIKPEEKHPFPADSGGLVPPPGVSAGLIALTSPNQPAFGGSEPYFGPNRDLLFQARGLHFLTSRCGKEPQSMSALEGFML